MKILLVLLVMLSLVFSIPVEKVPVASEEDFPLTEHIPTKEELASEADLPSEEEVNKPEVPIANATIAECDLEDLSEELNQCDPVTCDPNDEGELELDDAVDADDVMFDGENVTFKDFAELDEETEEVASDMQLIGLGDFLAENETDTSTALVEYYKWSGWLNGWDRPVKWCGRCRRTALTGLYSVHNNRREDRRWRYKARTWPRGMLRNVRRWTRWTRWHKTFTVARSNAVVVTIFSHHTNYYCNARCKRSNVQRRRIRARCARQYRTRRNRNRRNSCMRKYRNLRGVRVEDRRFRFLYQYLNTRVYRRRRARWSKYNRFDKPLKVDCGRGWVFGLHSVYKKYYRDRRFRVLCGWIGRKPRRKVVKKKYTKKTGKKSAAWVTRTRAVAKSTTVTNSVSVTRKK